MTKKEETKIYLTCDVIPKEGELTGNNRIYPPEVISEMYNQMQEQIDNGRCLIFHEDAFRDCQGEPPFHNLEDCIGRVEKIEDDGKLSGFVKLFKSNKQTIDFDLLKSLIKEEKVQFATSVIGKLIPKTDKNGNRFQEVSEPKFLGVVLVPKNKGIPEDE